MRSSILIRYKFSLKNSQQRTQPCLADNFQLDGRRIRRATIVIFIRTTGSSQINEGPPIRTILHMLTPPNAGRACSFQYLVYIGVSQRAHRSLLIHRSANKKEHVEQWYGKTIYSLNIAKEHQTDHYY